MSYLENKNWSDGTFVYDKEGFSVETFTDNCDIIKFTEGTNYIDKCSKRKYTDTSNNCANCNDKSITCSKLDISKTWEDGYYAKSRLE